MARTKKTTSNPSDIRHVPYYPLEFLHDDFDPRLYLPDLKPGELTADDISKASPEAPRGWLEIHENTATHRVTLAGRGGSKSTGWNADTCVFQAVRCPVETVRKFQGSLITGYMGPILLQTRNIIWERMKTVTAPFIDRKKPPNETKLEIKLVNGMWIKLLGSDQDPNKLRGYPFWFIVFDEADFQEKRVFSEFIEPRLADQDLVEAGGGRTGHCGTPSGKRWLYEKMIYARHDTTNTWKFWKWCSWQNPRINRAALAQTYLRLKREGNLMAWRQEYCAEFVAFAGQIYTQFDRDVHVRSFELDEDWPMVVSIDNGAHDPTACMVGAVDFRGRIWWRHEYQVRDEPISMHCKNINAILKPYGGVESKRIRWRVMDRTNKQLFYEYEQNGFYMNPARNTRDTVLPGIRRQQEYIKLDERGEPGMFFHPECHIAIDQHEQYRWKQRGNFDISVKDSDKVNELEMPLKSNDHLPDCVRYFVMELPGVPRAPIVDIRTRAERLVAQDLARAKRNATIGSRRKRKYEIDPIIGGWI